MYERLSEVVVKKSTRDKIAKLKQGKTYDQYINELLKEREGNPSKQQSFIPENSTNQSEVP
jgi:hypothetical protein